MTRAPSATSESVAGSGTGAPKEVMMPSNSPAIQLFTQRRVNVAHLRLSVRQTVDRNKKTGYDSSP